MLAALDVYSVSGHSDDALASNCKNLLCTAIRDSIFPNLMSVRPVNLS